MNNREAGGKLELILLLLILVFSLALSLVSIHVPFARDQGVAAYIGSLILHLSARAEDQFIIKEVLE
jgi:hypothetical protein